MNFNVYSKNEAYRAKASNRRYDDLEDRFFAVNSVFRFLEMVEPSTSIKAAKTGCEFTCNRDASEFLPSELKE